MTMDEARSLHEMDVKWLEEIKGMIKEDMTELEEKYVSESMEKIQANEAEVSAAIKQDARRRRIRNCVAGALYLLFASAFIYSFRLDWPLNIAVLGGGFVLFLIGNRVWDALERL